MKPQRFTLWAMLASAALATTTTLIVQQVRAAGIPAKNALTYTGFLENPDGTPVVTSKNIALAVYDAATAGTKVCEVLSAPMVPVMGRFQIALPDDCTAKVGASPDLWLEVAVDGAALGRTKIGAVPYAVEAGHAVAADTASGALATSLKTLEGSVHVKSGFSAWLSGAGPSLSGTAVAVVFDQVDFDLNGEYEVATGTFSPKQNGIYLVTCGFFFVSQASGVRYQAQIFLNGAGNPTEISGFDAHSSVAGNGICAATTTVAKLAAGDKLLCAAGMSGNAQTLYNGLPRRNHFEAALLF